jgi:asparagine synthase (glutamine-hydrolysing)
LTTGEASMCGIAGVLLREGAGSEAHLTEIARRMSDELVHRGPDDAGTWVDAECGIGLGFRRLAILDITPAGHQPMMSVCGRYVVIFNGEIYNHHELRRDVGEIQFRGHSDTEVMLAAFTKWGVPESTRRFNGMFSFAVWDRSERCLTLARDRMGEKPLYYSMAGGDFLFGSELKALRAAPGFRASIDRDALTLFFRHGYIPAPYTIHSGVAKLPPGTLLEVRASSCGTPQPYWSAFEAVRNGLSQPFAGSEQEAIDALDERLNRAVAMRLEADVPLGAFLSGGIDSSLVVALMQAHSVFPVRTFTIGFAETEFDEAPAARSVAKHLGTEHTELYVTSHEAQDVIPQLPTVYDEPFADSSQIPTLLVARLTRSKVTVGLSGDGGDEIFGGYPRYLLLDQLWARQERIPKPLRRMLAASLEALPKPYWDRLLSSVRAILPRGLQRDHPGESIHRLAYGLRGRTADQLYLALLSLWLEPNLLVLRGQEPPTALTSPLDRVDSPCPSARAMFKDSISYLPDDILAKVDRAAMAVSLETRAPLLDHTLYEFAWSLKRSQLIRDGIGKFALRQVLHRYVPAGLVDRPKMGFGVPIGLWLRQALRPWAEELLDVRTIRSQGLLDPVTVRKLWETHLTGKGDASSRLWAVLMLQSWMETQREPSG